MSLALENVTFTYMPKTPFEKTAINDVSLTVESGEFTAIIGHTGSGKTTLLQHFNGLLQPDKNKGSVYVDGEKITKKNLRDVRMKVGYVFQYPEHQLFEETVFKDIAFGLKRLKLSDEETRERVLAAAKTVELDEALLERSVFELSGGEKRRVAICGVIVTNPKYLLLDEPASGLDPQGKREIMKLLKSLNERGITIVFISHSMDDVAENARRVVIVNDGRIGLDGTPYEVFKNRELLTTWGLDVPEVTILFDNFARESGMDIPHVIKVSEGVELVRKLKAEGRLAQ
ncbi:MAG: energy-coupling factor transporter ATPase [Clostridia bacterium]|nr:energy-coupling factor transporter ATPase [Clostridia bacterium]